MPPPPSPEIGGWGRRIASGKGQGNDFINANLVSFCLNDIKKGNTQKFSKCKETRPTDLYS